MNKILNKCTDVIPITNLKERWKVVNEVEGERMLSLSVLAVLTCPVPQRLRNKEPIKQRVVQRIEWI